MRVAIADDDAVITSSLEIVLGAQPDIEVVGLAADGAEAARLASELAPDVVLLDIQMPGTDGLAAAEKILAAPHPPRVVFLTTFSDDEYIVRALALGAAPGERGAEEPDLAAMFPQLTAREREVVRLVAEGLDNREVAAAAYMGEGTVRNHISQILAKLGLRNRTQIAVAYWRALR